MPDDRETVVALLERIARRRRRNRFLREAAAGLSVLLLFPIAFKVVDLAVPFRGAAVALFFGIWLAASTVYLAWRLRGRESLAQIAAYLDRALGANDQIKTAYWFIRNPTPSPWVDAQIHQAGDRARRIELETICPRQLPSTSFIAAGLVLLLAGLNFLPLPWNHNWLYLQAAPAFSLSEDEQALVEQAKMLLQRAEAVQEARTAEDVQKVMNALEAGEISIAEALRRLAEIQQALDEGNLDLESIEHGLDEIASDLAESERLESVANSISERELAEAARRMRDIAEEIQASQRADREIQEKLEQASENPRAGLEQLAERMRQAAEALKRQETEGARLALEKTAEELEALSEKMQGQQFKNEASRRLQDLRQSLDERRRNSGGRQKQQAPPMQASSESAEQPDRDAGAMQPAPDGPQGPEGGQPGAPLPAAPGEGEGGGLFPTGANTAEQPLFGEPTELAVQLEREELTGQPQGGAPPAKKNDEEASRQERSRLDYRNTPSDLSPAQKDLLHQDRIPWEYRQLVKQYLLAIRAAQKP